MANNQANKGVVIDYDAIANQQSFKALVRRKNSFLWSMTVIFLAAYMLLPILLRTRQFYTKRHLGKSLGCGFMQQDYSL